MYKKIYILFWIILLCNNNIVISQTTCSGSLGDPIVNVTFGQGANPGAPFSISVPGASTSYAYSAPTGNPASNTVFDGQYALVNSVPSNPAWLTGGDHTNPGSGYMAFFNAAPSPGEFYSQTVTGLCAGTTYEFAAWILNAINSNILPNAVQPNVTFKIYNPANLITPIVSFSTGNIPAQNTILWRRFSTLFTTPMGINSVILVLSNNNVGGTNLVGNDMAIDDITFRACGPLTVASFSPSSVLSNLTLCKNVPYTLYGTSGAGLSTPSYQWQVSSNNGATWLNIATANSLIYTSPGNNSGLYKFRLQSQEAGNTGSSFCKFYSAPIDLTVTNCIGTKIINDYTPIQSLDICKNIIVVEDGSKYNVGDTVLMIQMKGAVIDSSNTTSFGNITDFKSAGNYELNYVKSRNGNAIELKNKIIRTYEIPVGKVQLIRVPYFTNYIVTDTLTCLPWDGSKGGVLVLNVQNTLTLNNPIDVSGKGFKGGIGFNSNSGALSCNYNDFSYPASSQVAGLKGESIAQISNAKTRGKGKIGNGGGGGLGHNSGGGGGSNGGAGGFGGYQLDNCGGAPFDNRGFGGSILITNSTINKIFLGGGGGAGQADNVGNIPPGGGNGGGIIIITCDKISANSKNIISNGSAGVVCVEGFGSDCHDGMGGGGAGGTILVAANTFLDNITIVKNGGKGANVASTITSAGKIGPGGGGAGGVLFLNKPALPPQINSVSLGGQNGILVLDNNSSWGATGGSNGTNYFNLSISSSTVSFKPNIDSVRITASFTTCNNFTFNGLGYTNTNPIASWQWNFGDGGTATTQNTSHTYTNANTYLVKLIVTDINGCKDSITRTVVSTCLLTTSTIINDYTPILSLDICKNIIGVEDGIKYNVGDTILMIQMKGAIIDSSNTASFGNITDYKSAGNYEFNYVKSKTGNAIELKNKILRTYEIPTGKVQLIRVPYFTNYVVIDTLTCLAWDGSKGGVLVFNVQNNLSLNNAIDVSGKGFKGGIGFNTNASALSCNFNEYSYPLNNQLSGLKGESIATILDNKIRGKGKLAGGGGGGLGHNSGGGGGGNGGNGGLGGYQLDNCGNAPFDNRGIGGSTILTNTLINKIFLGSGGGAGQADNSGNIPPGGGNGGGMIIISCNNLQANTHKIISNGFGGVACFEAPGSDCHDGMGGGGAGGTVLLTVNTFLDNLTVSKNGGNGANVSSTVASAGKIGPGGGGAGGFMFLNKPTLPPQLTSLNFGGQNGILVLNNNSNWGATPGTNGLNIFNLSVPISTIPFKSNIDSVRINTAQSSCTAFNFNGLGFINTNPIASWQWNFGDGGTATGQNTTHSYAAANTYLVKLVVTDINGCKDSITTNVTSNSVAIDAGIDKTFCGSQNNVQLNSSTPATGSVSYSWSSNPSTTISNSSSPNPTATVSVNTTFYVTVTNPQGCSGNDSVKVFINTIPIVKTLDDTSICRGTALQLSTTTGLNSYQWTNGLFVSDSTISNPFFVDSLPRILIVTGSNGLCIAKDTITVNIKPSPLVKSIPDTLICSNQTINLTTTGALSYTWTPSYFLDNYSISNPAFFGDSSILYFVTGSSSNGCSATDTVKVSVNVPNALSPPPNKSFCTNSSVLLDGNNGNSYSYNWSPSTYLNNPSIINPIANPPVNFIYTVNIKDWVCNYDSNFSVIVTANPLPILNLTKSNDINCALNTAKLNVTGAAQYIWDAAPSLSSLVISNPLASPIITTEYLVTGIDSNGCINKNKIAVLVSLDNNKFDLPNAFTPNADGKNDCFGLKSFGAAQKIYFIIYSRWGEKMFETNDINICWDGRYKGQPVEAGNYVYYVTAKTACGDIIRKGNVILIR